MPRGGGAPQSHLPSGNQHPCAAGWQAEICEAQVCSWELNGASRKPLTAKAPWAPLMGVTASAYAGCPRGESSPLWDINSLARCGSACSLFLELCRVPTAAQASAPLLGPLKASHVVLGWGPGIYEVPFSIKARAHTNMT